MRRVLPAIVVSLFVSAALLASAASNRMGSPTSETTLTERELQTGRQSDRDSSRHLSLQTTPRLPDAGTPADESWLNDSTLRTLGFHCPTPEDTPVDTSRRNCGLARRGFAVFEFDGAEAQRVADRLRQQGEDNRKGAQTPNAFNYDLKRAEFGTRLVAVDASPDAGSLRTKYPDSTRYLILPAVIRAERYQSTPTGSTSKVVTTVDVRPLVSMIVVAKSAGAERLPTTPGDCYMCSPPRYRARLVAGRRYEPWIAAIEPIDSR